MQFPSLSGTLSRTSSLIVAILCLVCATQFVFAQRRFVHFSFADLTEPARISDSGAVVGVAMGQEGIDSSAFVRYPNGQHLVFQVPLPGCSAQQSILATRATSVNNRGMIVGTSESDCAPFHLAFLRLASGAIIHLKNKHGNVFPTGINDFGDIVGYVDGYAGFVRDIAGRIRYLRYGNTIVMPTAINNAGEIVGTYKDSAFVYKNGRFRFLKYKDASGIRHTTVFMDINNRGDIFGYYEQGTDRKMFVLKGGHHFQRVTLPNLLFVSASSFNSFGDVVGSFGSQTSPTVDGYISFHLIK